MFFLDLPWLSVSFTVSVTIRNLGPSQRKTTSIYPQVEDKEPMFFYSTVDSLIGTKRNFWYNRISRHYYSVQDFGMNIQSGRVNLSRRLK